MKEFNKWFANIEKEYPLYQEKDGHNIGNRRALEVGWKGAMGLVLTTFKYNLATEDDDELVNVYKMIEEELESKYNDRKEI